MLLWPLHCWLRLRCRRSIRYQRGISIDCFGAIVVYMIANHPVCGGRFGFCGCKTINGQRSIYRWFKFDSLTIEFGNFGRQIVQFHFLHSRNTENTVIIVDHIFANNRCSHNWCGCDHWRDRTIFGRCNRHFDETYHTIAIGDVRRAHTGRLRRCLDTNSITMRNT